MARRQKKLCRHARSAAAAAIFSRACIRGCEYSHAAIAACDLCWRTNRLSVAYYCNILGEGGGVIPVASSFRSPNLSSHTAKLLCGKKNGFLH